VRNPAVLAIRMRRESGPFLHHFVSLLLGFAAGGRPTAPPLSLALRLCERVHIDNTYEEHPGAIHLDAWNSSPD